MILQGHAVTEGEHAPHSESCDHFIPYTALCYDASKNTEFLVYDYDASKNIEFLVYDCLKFQVTGFKVTNLAMVMYYCNNYCLAVVTVLQLIIATVCT